MHAAGTSSHTNTPRQLAIRPEVHADALAEIGIDEAVLDHAIESHRAGRAPRLRRLWSYYRNDAQTVVSADRDAPLRVRLAQECGLPDRLRTRSADVDDRAESRREAVIENDIGWRVDTMVDFMFGKPIVLSSTAEDESQRRLVERVLDAAWEASGGIALLQDIALLGHVYGSVDLVLRVDERLAAAIAAGGGVDVEDEARLIDLASRLVRVEVVEPTRAVPIQDDRDYRQVRGFAIHHERELNEMKPRSLGDIARGVSAARRRRVSTELITPTRRRLYEDGKLVAESLMRFTGGVLPMVHIQNLSQPFRYDGLSEVEALIPLQDELNTRLSDRASRVTLQSFRMYLAKGIDGFDRAPIGPGQVWVTDNPDAEIVAFGGDGLTPSEDAHVLEVREAMDKTSGVPPLASGVVRAKIGNLSSANALRITLMGVLSKTARKRVTYGRGLIEMSRLMLAAFDAAGVVRTDASERGLRIEWPDPLPVDVREQVASARAKRELGVPDERVLAELGYAATDPGIV